MTQSYSVVPVAPPATGQVCPRCGRDPGMGIACQVCQQVLSLPVGVQLSSVGKRFGAYLMDIVLSIFTLFIGYLIWALIVYARGQTPAKQLFGMRVVKIEERRAAGWGITFVREFLKGIITYTVILAFWLAWDKNRQELWDKAFGTIVVDDPMKQLEPTKFEAQPRAASLPPGQPAAPTMPAPTGPPVETPPAQAQPPAGWYPDPAGAAQWRYWDGNAWTEQVQ